MSIEPAALRAVLGDVPDGAEVRLELADGSEATATVARDASGNVSLERADAESDGRGLELVDVERVLLDAASLPEGPE